MKRANGTGTIVQRRDKKRRLPFSVYINGGRDEEGRRKRISLGSYRTHREAQEALEKYRLGLTIQPGKETPLKEIWRLYMESQEALGRPVNANYRSTWKNYIEPELGNYSVSDIKTLHMQTAINKCRSASVQRFIKAIFTNLFQYALANDLALKDYSAPLKTQVKEASSLHKPFTTEELRQLWQNVDKDVIKIVLIQIYTGTRKSELAGIRMENVRIREQYMTGGLKTQAGKNRVIPIADCILRLVEHFYSISRLCHYDYLIMPDMEREINGSKGMAALDPIYRKHVPGHATHDARHTFVTLCENYGIDSMLVKKIVGHAGSITEDVYTHKSIAQLLDAVNKLPHGSGMAISPDEKIVTGVATG